MTKVLRILWGFLALASLTVCLLAALGFFLGKISASQYKAIFLGASLSWFVWATAWLKNPKP